MHDNRNNIIFANNYIIETECYIFYDIEFKKLIEQMK